MISVLRLLLICVLLIKVLQAGSGELVVVRMPDSYKHAADFLPCHMCLGFYLRDTLYKHIKSCSCRPDSKRDGYGAISKGMTIISQLIPASNIDPELSQLINGMRETTKNPGTYTFKTISKLVLFT